MSKRLIVALALVIVALSSGCMTAMLTKAIVQAPNERDVPHLLRPANAAQLAKYDATYAEAWKVHVAEPAADLAVAVIEPGDYGLTHSIKSAPTKDGRTHYWPQSDWTLPAKPWAGGATPKGTILVLHGYQDTKESMIHWALYLAQTGYRVVLVDLRGHGRSSGEWIGYGAFEVADLKRVLDDVQQRGLVAGPIGVLGLSYGASVALQLAGHDARIRSVVAMEPFSDPRRAVVEFAHAVVPKLVADWTPADFTKAEDRAGQMAHFEWSKADVLDSVARTDAPVLFVIAEKDHWISPENTNELAARTKGIHAVATVTFQNDGGIEQHVLLSWLLDPMAPKVGAWFDESLLHPGTDLKERLAKAGIGVNDEPKGKS